MLFGTCYDLIGNWTTRFEAEAPVKKLVKISAIIYNIVKIIGPIKGINTHQINDKQ